LARPNSARSVWPRGRSECSTADSLVASAPLNVQVSDVALQGWIVVRPMFASDQPGHPSLGAGWPIRRSTVSTQVVDQHLARSTQSSGRKRRSVNVCPRRSQRRSRRIRDGGGGGISQWMPIGRRNQGIPGEIEATRGNCPSTRGPARNATAATN
jgi:hypothetical protein